MILFAYNLAIILIAIFFAYLSWRKIEFGIWAIVFLLPAYLLRFAVYGIPTTVLEMMVYILFCIWLIKNYGNIKWREIIPDKILIVGIILLMAGASISAFLSIDLRTSAGILKGWFFDPFLFFIVLVSTVKSSGWIENTLKVFFLSGFAVAAVSLLYWFGLLPNGVSYDNRLHGIYSSPNYLAMYLAPALIIGVWMFLKNNFLSVNSSLALPLLISPSRVREGEKIRIGKRRDFFSVISSEARNPLDIKKSEFKRFLPACWRVEMTKYLHFLFQRDKIFWLISASVMTIAIYLTYSYAAWLAIFSAIALLFYFTAGNEKKLSFQWKLSFLSIFLVLAILFFSQSGTSKFENLKNLAYRSSASSRIMIWRSALAIGRDHPVFGIGPGNFQKFYLDYQKKFSEPYLEWAVPEPHNIFLAFWLETGILGFAGFILILIWFFKEKIPPNLPLQRGIKGDLNAKERDLLIILTAVMVYILLHGLFDTTYWKNDLAMIFWLILGLMAVVKKQRLINYS